MTISGYDCWKRKGLSRRRKLTFSGSIDLPNSSLCHSHRFHTLNAEQNQSVRATVHPSPRKMHCPAPRDLLVVDDDRDPTDCLEASVDRAVGLKYRVVCQAEFSDTVLQTTRRDMLQGCCQHTDLLHSVTAILQHRSYYDCIIWWWWWWWLSTCIAHYAERLYCATCPGALWKGMSSVLTEKNYTPLYVTVDNTVGICCDLFYVNDWLAYFIRKHYNIILYYYLCISHREEGIVFSGLCQCVSAVAALHQGVPGQMTWLEDPPPWLKPCVLLCFRDSVNRK